ncbi:hypothetical protein SLX97_004518 [Salmonella enterica]|nr:hypothetical protein [Salmonella enterica]OIN38437.1 hypothetical protein AO411_2025450 [Salmonella enterica subsp. enterica serovar Sarajane]EIO1438422.1 hypothetical protein [Salmonella enterica]EIZ1383886.1 hypothetical protein [Salmonella enterica]EKH8549317.1 hypothetical protein [Salmonella enterica]
MNEENSVTTKKYPNKNANTRTLYIHRDTKEQLYERTAFISGKAGVPVRPSALCDYIISHLINKNLDNIIEHFKKKKPV